MAFNVILVLSVALLCSSVRSFEIKKYGNFASKVQSSPWFACVQDFRELMARREVQASKLMADCDKANQTMAANGCKIMANERIAQFETKVRSMGDQKISRDDIEGLVGFDDLMYLGEQYRQCGRSSAFKTG